MNLIKIIRDLISSISKKEIEFIKHSFEEDKKKIEEANAALVEALRQDLIRAETKEHVCTCDKQTRKRKPPRA
jgi:adenine-specific DNA methylase